MSEVVTAEQIEAFRTNGFVVVDDLLTDAELDTFEPLVTAAVAYRSAGRRAHTRGTPPHTSPQQSPTGFGGITLTSGFAFACPLRRPGQGGLTGHPFRRCRRLLTPPELPWPCRCVMAISGHCQFVRSDFALVSE
jgi:hypothetical protein